MNNSGYNDLSEKKNVAPIFITIYNRLGHLKECINSLKICDLASESSLYVFSDAAGTKDDVEEVSKIRKYILTITGFKQVIPVFSEVNIGLLQAFSLVSDRVFKEYDRLIFLEDDNIVSPDFLKFVNDGLEFYANNDKVYSICAFSHSIFFDYDINDTRTYFCNRFSAWGCGVWRDKFLEAFDHTIDDVRSSLNEKEFRDKLDSIGKDLVPSFISIISQGQMITADFLFTYHLVKNNLFVVTPYISKSFNIGNDGSGTRTSQSRRFMQVNLGFLHENHDYAFTEDIFSNINNSFYRRYFNTSYQKAKRFLLKLGLLNLVVKLKRRNP